MVWLFFIQFLSYVYWYEVIYKLYLQPRWWTSMMVWDWHSLSAGALWFSELLKGKMHHKYGLTFPPHLAQKTSSENNSWPLTHISARRRKNESEVEENWAKRRNSEPEEEEKWVNKINTNDHIYNIIFISSGHIIFFVHISINNIRVFEF